MPTNSLDPDGEGTDDDTPILVSSDAEVPVTSGMPLSSDESDAELALVPSIGVTAHTLVEDDSSDGYESVGVFSDSAPFSGLDMSRLAISPTMSEPTMALPWRYVEANDTYEWSPEQINSRNFDRFLTRT